MSGDNLLRLYTKSASYYDAVYDVIYDPYSGKDYKSESNRLRLLIRRYKRSDGKSLLDVAVGTGRHLYYLKAWFDVEGLDINRKMLAIAQERNPGVKFHQGDMLTFKLHKKFDVISCLFSAIGYMTTLAKLRRAIRNMALHLEPGGLLIIEPWITPRNFKSGKLHAVLVNQPELKLARIGRSLARGKISLIDFHYLIATPEDTRYFRETEKFGLFTHSEYLGAFGAAGLRVAYDRKGLTGRGLYVGIKPRDTT
jgi:SAM-dependent methyltransferase